MGAAREWYLKSLAILERQGNEHVAAIIYHRLGRIAENQRDLVAARKWYLKSLAIRERQGDEQGAAATYGQLGNIAGLESNMQDCGIWLTRCIRSFIQLSEHGQAEGYTRNLLIFFRRASPEDKRKLKAIWADANLGPFPTEPSEAA